MRTSTPAVLALSGLAAVANAQVFSGGGFSIESDDSRQINIDITDLVGEFDGFILTVDFGGDRPNNSEFDLDLRALLRTNTDVPFTLFLDDNNFSFSYDANNVLTVEDGFMSTLNGTDYDRLRLTMFNDDSGDLDIESWTLTLVPTPGAVALFAGTGLIAARRRRA